MARFIYTILFFVSAVFAVAQPGPEYNKMYDLFKNKPIRELIRLGDAYSKQQIIDSALVCYTIVAAEYDEQLSAEDKEYCVHAYNASGTIYYYMCNYVQALDLYLRALKVCEDYGYDTYIPRIYNNLGNIYSSFSDYEKAKSFYEKAYRLSLEYANEEAMQTILTNLMGICCETKEYDKAYYYSNTLDSISSDSAHLFFTYSTKGIIKRENKKYEESLHNLRLAYRQARLSGMGPRYEFSSLYNMVSTFVHMQQNDSCFYYIDKCEKLARLHNLTNFLADSYGEKSYIYSLQGDIPNSLLYKEKFLNLNDSIRSLFRYKDIKDMEFFFEMNKIEKQVSSMKTEKILKDNQIAQQRKILFFISFMLLIILLLLFYLYMQKKKLQSSYKDIFDKNIEIVRSEQQIKLRHQRTQQELAEKDCLIAQQKERIEELGKQLNLSEAETLSGLLVDTDSDGKQMKYQTSALNDEQRISLIQSIEDIMESTLEFCNTDFTLEKLAAMVGSKIKYVSQAINETYGKNFNRYVNEYRIKEARLRLTNPEKYGNYTIKAIAESVGFKSNANFNSLFKEITGITPSIYQKMMQENS